VFIPSVFAVILATLPVLDAAPAAEASSNRPRIGLALSGGGARGAAHIGVLKVLEEHRIPIDLIAGTSMGALVGGLYASGQSPAQLDSVISEVDWKEAFANKIPRGVRSFRRKRDDDLFLVKSKPGLRGGRLIFAPGVLDGQQIDLLLKRLSLPVAAIHDFDQLSIPYRAVAADIVTGEAVVLERGDLALAMRASMSIPAVFAPRRIDGRLLVDGGIADNLPINLARRMGAEVIISVDISTPAQKEEQLSSVLAIASQLGTFASVRTRDQQIASLGPDDVFIRPELGTIATASFDRTNEAIPIGRQAAEGALAQLERLAVPPEEYGAYRAARAARTPTGAAPVIGAVRIVNRSRLSDRVIAARLDVPIGEPLDVRRLEQELNQVFGLEQFESVYYDLAPGPQGDTLTVTARERAWGPNYIQAGVASFEDYEHPNFNVQLAYSRTAVNGLNGEWRTGAQVGQEFGAWTEFYQPLDRRLRTFADVQISAIEWSMNAFDGTGHKLSEVGVIRYGGTLAGGREIGTWGELRAGIVRQGGRMRVLVGDPTLAARRFDTGEAFAQMFVDKLDEVAFPRHGGSLRVRGSAGLDALGSAVEYEQVLLEGNFAGTLGRFTGMLGGMFGTARNSDAPLESCFRLGGLGQLTGLEQDELVGQHAALLRAMLYRRVTKSQLLPVYAGLSAEYGNVFESRSEIAFDHGIAAGSLILGVDTPLGPLCGAYGRAEGGRGNLYLSLGQPLGGRRPGFPTR